MQSALVIAGILLIVLCIIGIQLFTSSNISEKNISPTQSIDSSTCYLTSDGPVCYRNNNPTSYTQPIISESATRRPVHKPTKIDEIIVGKLYISDFPSSKDYSKLSSLGIKQILTVGVELPRHGSDKFTTMHIPISDEPSVNIIKYFPAATKFIHQAPTLVHCAMGISRSASMVLAYLMKYYGYSLNNALSLARSKRPIINPNTGFLEQLSTWEQDTSK